MAIGSCPERPSRLPQTQHTSVSRLCAILLGVLAPAAVILWVSPPAYALPSFTGQTGLPCSACHVGGFGPQLTPFGIYFKATGYSLGGGTGVWSHIPVNYQILAGYTHLAKDRPTAPKGYGTNDFVTPGCSSFVIAAGHSFEGKFGVGGIGKVFINLSNAFVVQSGQVASLGPSDIKFTKPLTVGSHSLVVALDLNNQATISDPYDNNLYSYYGQGFSMEGPANAISPGASPHITGVVKGVVGTTLSVLLDNAIYVEGGIYESMNAAQLASIGTSPPSVGYIAGGAPYFRLAYQHAWGNNFLEIGGLVMDIPYQQVAGIANTSAENEYVDWGLDAMYERTYGPDILAITANYLFETQNLGATFGARLSSNSSDTLDQFRITATYAWNGATEFSLAYIDTWGSTDAKLYPAAPLTGSADHSPNSQTIIAQVDWAPWGNNTNHWGYPWLNVRVGVQYRYYLQFNGGTTNYDGFGRNATDNNTVLIFTVWSF